MSDEEHKPQEQPQPEARVLFARAVHALQAKRLRAAPDEKHYDGYQYVSGQSVRKVVLAAAAEVGLTIELVDTEVVEEKELETNRGKLQWMTDVRCVFEVTEVRGGWSRRYTVLGRRTNDSDKGVMHSIAQAEKVFLSRLAMIGEAEDPDASNPDESARNTGNSRREQQRGRGKSAPRRHPNAPPELEPDESPPPAAAPKKKKRFERHGENEWHDTETNEIVPQCPCDVRAPVVAGACQHPNCDWVDPRQKAPKPPKRNGDKAGDHANKLAEEKNAYARLVGNVEPWQEDALALVHPDLPNEHAEWGFDHYRMATQVMRKEGAITLLTRAVEEAAKKQPVQDAEVTLLRELASKAGLGFAQQSQVETAIASRWAKAVADTIRWVGPLAQKNGGDG